MRLARVAVGLALLALLALAGCNASSAPRTPEETCRAACEPRVHACTQDGCDRGCNFVLDRIVEHQLDPILACMASASTCDDTAWARCSVRVGSHADGGPPAPPPPPEEE